MHRQLGRQVVSRPGGSGSAGGYGGALLAPLAGSGAEPQPKSNLVPFYWSRLNVLGVFLSPCLGALGPPGWWGPYYPCGPCGEVGPYTMASPGFVARRQRWKLCHGALTVNFRAGCSSCSMTNGVVTNAVLIERTVSCWQICII